MKKIAIAKLTLQCNANCKNCTTRKLNFKDRGMDKNLTLIEFTNFCKQFKSIGGNHITLSGGEPTLIPNLEEYIKIATDLGISTRLVTNGIGINRESLNKWIENGLDQIAISLYSTDLDIYCSLRPNATLYEKAMEAVTLLKDYSDKITLILQTLISKQNYMCIPKLLTYAYENKFHYLFTSLLENAIDLHDLRLTSKDIDKFNTDVINEIKKILNIKFEGEHLAELENNLEKLKHEERYIDGIYKDIDDKLCSFFGNFFLLYTDGKIAFCPGYEYFRGQEVYLKDTNLEDIDYSKVKEFVSQKCIYCPHGKHVSFKLNYMAKNLF